ncbi:hypothetical protein K0B04_03110 [Patescibacteria group bacterium]|nr:hypothetical protein [Patescibacteria group bacterium]
MLEFLCNMDNFSPKSICNTLKDKINHVASNNLKVYLSLIIFLIIISFSLFIQMSLESKEILRSLFLHKNDTQYLNIHEQENPKEIIEDENNSQGGVTSDTVKEEKGTVENLEVSFYGYPLEVKKEFDLFNPRQMADGVLYDQDSDLTKTFKTGDVAGGYFYDPAGLKIDLSGYQVFVLEYNCFYFRVLANDSNDNILILSYRFYHPSCWYDESELKDHVSDIHRAVDFDYIFDLDYTSWYQFKSDGGYEFNFSTLPNLESTFTSRDGLEIVDERDGEYIYRNPDEKEYESFIIFTSEGFYSTGVHIPSIYDRKIDDENYWWQHDFSQTISIKLVNGETVTYTYTMLSCDEVNCSTYYVDKSSFESFKYIGKGIDGSEIFTKKDSNNSFLKEIYSKYYIDGNVNVNNEIMEDDDTPFTYEQFLESIPVIYWKNPFGKMLRFIRWDFIDTYDCCFAS